MAYGERSTVPATAIDRLFAYGTLQPGQGAYGVVAPFVQAVLPATVRGSMYAFPASHPGVVPDDGGLVHGTLLQLAELPAALPLLDAYEGDDFMRILTEASTDGGPTWAWIYVLASPDLARLGQPVPHGNWLRYQRELGR
ncbi:MAG: gamma-glutamylcyclotransferase [Kofleriaceae bacterium]